MPLRAVACRAALALALPGSAGAANAVSGRLIVGFTAGTSHQRAASLVQGAGAPIERRLDRIGALLVRYSEIRSAIKASVVPDAALAGKT